MGGRDPSGHGVSMFTDPELALMAKTHHEHLELEGEELLRAQDAEERREHRLRAADREQLVELLEPGAWNCKWCRSINPPATSNCTGHRKHHFAWVKCGGSQTESWGGYAKPPAAAVRQSRKRDRDSERIKTARELRPRLQTRIRTRNRDSFEPIPAELSAEARQAREEERLKLDMTTQEFRPTHHDMNKRRREDYKSTAKKGKADACHADPNKWPCQYCHPTEEDRQDVYNPSSRNNCRKCQRKRADLTIEDDDWKSEWSTKRWKCPNCYDETIAPDTITVSGLTMACGL